MAVAVSAVGFLIVLGLGFALGRAALLDSKLLRAQIAQKLADWTGGTVKLAGPVALSYFPVVAFDVEQVAITDAKRLPAIDSIEAKRLRIEIGIWPLISGNMQVDRLRFTEPRIGLTPNAPEADGNRVPTLIRALQSAPFSHISVERGEVIIATGRLAERMTDLDAEIALTAEGASTARGRFTWRGNPLDFSVKTDFPTVVANTAKSPIELSVTGPLVSGRITGEATIADGAQINGTLEMDVPDLRRFVNWVGLMVPDGRGLGAFKAAGSVNWVGQKIAVVDGSFELDGNRASGAVALQFADPRPALEGTLAVTDLKLSQYMALSRASKAMEPDAKPAANLTFPLLHHFDVDLRISATELRAKAITIGETALTLTVKSGVLAAEFAIFDLCGGKGNGRLELNAAKTLPRMQLSAKFDSLVPESCIELFHSKSPIRGANSHLSVALSSEGGTSQDLIKRLAGKLAVTMQAGKISIDPLKVVNAARKGTLRGWESVLGGSRDFETLTADFLIGDGNATSDKFEVVTGRTTVTGRGTIDIATRKLHWRVKIADEALGRLSRFGNIVAELVDSLIIQGPLADPTFRLERRQASRDETPRGTSTPLFLGTLH